ncbi:MAG: DUF86 domain-containing protein [Nitrospinae bacterium]|nr:DUF86 domain-containing protein [Nitrospinota bacterium]
MKEDRVYLDHISECLGWIARHIAEGGREAFLNDRKTQSAVLRELQTLAESSQRLSQPLKDNHPEVPWRGLAGFRNVLAHDYLGINLGRVWEVVERDLPVLRAAIEKLRQG